MRGSLVTKGKNYYGIISIKGKKKWGNLHIPTDKGNKRKAEQALSKIVAEYCDNPDIFNKNDFVEFAQQWLKYVANHVDTVTYKGYEQYTSKHIIPYFEPLKLKIQDMTIKDIESYYNYKSIAGRLDGKKGGLSLRSIKLHGVALSQIFEYAMYNGLIKDNPCKYAKYPTQKNMASNVSSIYSAKQCSELLKITEGTMLYKMIYITFLYGLRRSELMGLKWSAVDFRNGTLTIKHTVVLNGEIIRKDKTKNRSSNRTYPLLPEVRQIFEQLLKQQEINKATFGNCYENNDYIFVKADGSPFYPSYPSHELAKVIKENNMQHIRWHDLRHSTASLLIEKGWQMKDISDWLGHSSITTTMNIYGHLSMEHKREMANGLTGLFER